MVRPWVATNPDGKQLKEVPKGLDLDNQFVHVFCNIDCLFEVERQGLIINVQVQVLSQLGLVLVEAPWARVPGPWVAEENGKSSGVSSVGLLGHEPIREETLEARYQHGPFPRGDF